MTIPIFMPKREGYVCAYDVFQLNSSKYTIPYPPACCKLWTEIEKVYIVKGLGNATPKIGIEVSEFSPEAIVLSLGNTRSLAAFWEETRKSG